MVESFKWKMEMMISQYERLRLAMNQVESFANSQGHVISRAILHMSLFTVRNGTCYVFTVYVAFPYFRSR
jgi:hypothetical protein